MGANPARTLFDSWAHEASLLPHPRLRWRVARGDCGAAGDAAMRAFAGERSGEAMVPARSGARGGPLAAAQIGRGRTG